jgi:hypothetical protein
MMGALAFKEEGKPSKMTNKVNRFILSSIPAPGSRSYAKF